jgi:glycosyltransferase involved in cell wall biosynthesis
VLEDDGLRKEMGKNARIRVIENFTWRKIAEDTLDVYAEVVDGGV